MNSAGLEAVWQPRHIVAVARRKLPGTDLLRRLKPRFGRKGPGKPPGEAGEPALVEPNKPLPLMGGAAAPVEEEA